MYKEVLRSIEGVDIYPIISLTLFFISFSIITIKVLLMKEKDLEHLAAIPNNDSNTKTNSNN
jgi:hypothetical protein